MSTSERRLAQNLIENLHEYFNGLDPEGEAYGEHAELLQADHTDLLAQLRQCADEIRAHTRPGL